MAQQVQYFSSGPSHEFTPTIEKDANRANVKKYQKYDPANGQYHQEVKPTKKYVTYKPIYQYSQPQQIASSAQTAPQTQQLSAQQLASQPLHYQTVHQISQQEVKPGQQPTNQPQSQYSIVVPQSAVRSSSQPSYYSQDISNANPTFHSYSERLISNQYGSAAPNQFGGSIASNQQYNENKQGSQPDIRVQYVHFGTPTPTPTPARPKYTENEQNQPLKYELYDPQTNQNIAKEKPTIKLIPQHLHRPQYAEHSTYYKKIKLQPQQYVQPIVRYQQPTPQPTQVSQQQSQSDILVPIQPSRSAIFVATGTGTGKWQFLMI